MGPVGLIGPRAAASVLAAVWICGGATAAAQTGKAPPIASRFELCQACHGHCRHQSDAWVPHLAGQHSFYAITQLFLFRQGRRADPQMTAVAKTMTDDDLRAYSDHIATLPAAPPSTAGDSQQMARGAAVAQRSHCAGCHGQDYAGGKQVPRIARQREEYLRQTLEEFRQGKRIGYTPAMNEALAGISGPEIEDLAHYLAHRP